MSPEYTLRQIESQKVQTNIVFGNAIDSWEIQPPPLDMELERKMHCKA